MYSVSTIKGSESGHALDSIKDLTQSLQVEGKPVPSSLLGYRITSKFATRFFGRVFGNPSVRSNHLNLPFGAAQFMTMRATGGVARDDPETRGARPEDLC